MSDLTHSERVVDSLSTLIRCMDEVVPWLSDSSEGQPDDDVPVTLEELTAISALLGSFNAGMSIAA